MGSLVIQNPAAPGIPAAAADPIIALKSMAGGASRTIPELAEATFVSQVLAGSTDSGDKTSETQLDEELAARATALGISTTATTTSRPSTAADQPNPSSRESAVTQTTGHARTDSSDSDGSTGTALTSHSSARGVPASSGPAVPVGGGGGAGSEGGHVVTRRRSRNLSFSQYDKYLAHVDPNLKQLKFVKDGGAAPESAPSLFSIGTRKSYISIKRTIKNKVRWRRASTGPNRFPISCICCRDDFNKVQALQTLPCGHTYCVECLRIMISQSGTDESKMPPRCCTQPIPTSIVKTVLGREEQQSFLKAVLQFSTPWEARIFCPNAACGEFIRPRARIDPKHPFDVVCRQCRTRVCVMCKRDAHPLGQDCPADWELDAVLKMGEKSGWRRCYKCRTLVELSQGCTHMTCRCKAQFCYICGAVWDGAVGCPNYCNGEEEMERRRIEEQARMAELEAEKEAREKAAVAAEAERQLAAGRSAASAEFASLKAQLEEEMQRFVGFERKTKWMVWSRHTQERLALAEKFSDQADKMRERHAKTVQHLDDRQIAAEMDLRASLEQRARSVRIRLRHMEAYCDGLGQKRDGTRSAAVSPPGSSHGGGDGGGDGPGPEFAMPARVVTERDLRELGQQYNMRDDLERLHQSRINVLRDQQAKSMEELQERQEDEMERLMNRREEEVEDLEAAFVAEDDALSRAFAERRARARARWRLRIEILQKEMENKTGGLPHGPIPLPEWPSSADGDRSGDILSIVEE